MMYINATVVVVVSLPDGLHCGLLGELDVEEAGLR